MRAAARKRGSRDACGLMPIWHSRCLKVVISGIDRPQIRRFCMDGCERVGSLCPIAVSVSNSAAGSEGLPGESMRALVPISSSGVARARLPAGHRGHPTLRHIPSLGAGAKCGLVQILILLCVFASSANAVGTNFSTILAGSGQDMALAVTSDAQGNVYVAGRIYSPDFPVTADAFQVTDVPFPIIVLAIAGNRQNGVDGDVV